jgi:hypothetical protein
MIANMATAIEGGGMRGRDWVRLDDYIFRDREAPRYVHTDRDRAEIELLRLQAAHPSGEFCLLESVAFAEKIDGFDRSIIRVSEVQS